MSYLCVLCSLSPVQLDKGDADNLNVQVQWSSYSKKYWVYYYCCQLLPARPHTDGGVPPILKVGDKVRVKRSVSTPR